jgi:hypothetical protein
VETYARTQLRPRPDVITLTQIASRTSLLTRLPIDTRVVVRGATTELDPAFFGRPPSLDTGRVVLSGAVTAVVEFDDGTRVFGLPWAVIEADDR